MRNLIIAVLLFASFASCKKQTTVNNTTAIVHTETSEQANAVTPVIQWSGHSWYVKNSGTEAWGPGPNYWTKNNVWVDANGWLHLRIKKAAAGKWQCAEIWSEENFGYGTYQWQVEGAIDKFDKNIVLGLFNYSGNDGYDEMDIEFARWGNSNYPNLNYTIWPATQGYNNFSYTQEFSLAGTYTTQRFTRTANSVVLKSLHGFYNDDTNLYATATCTSPPNSISTLAMPVHINLWLFQGNAPTNNKAVEVIIHNFTFTPQ